MKGHTSTTARKRARYAMPGRRTFPARRGVARPERFELPTAWFVARYSIQLSYGRNGEGGRLSDRTGAAVNRIPG